MKDKLSEFCNSRKRENDVIACHLLADRKMLEEKDGKTMRTLDPLFTKANYYNKGNNRGATVLIHLRNKSTLLKACRKQFVHEASHVVYDSNDDFIARGDIQLRSKIKTELQVPLLRNGTPKESQESQTSQESQISAIMKYLTNNQPILISQHVLNFVLRSE